MEDLIGKLRHIYVALVETDKLYSKVGKKIGLNSHQLSILYHLDFNTNVTQKQISEALLMPKQTINSILQSWIKLGYLNLVKLDNQKEKVIVLTKSGKIFMNECLKNLHEIEKNVLLKMGNENTEKYIETTDLYLKYLKEEVNND